MKLVVVLTLILALAGAPASAGAPATITVVVRQPPQRVVLKLVPNYALVLAFDQPIGTVGIGDDTLVATAVRETDLIMKALGDAGGNRSKAAEMLGIYRRLLYAKIKEYGLEGYPPKGR